MTDKTDSSWLVRDDKALISDLSLDIFTLSEKLQREPMSVLRRFREDRVLDLLTKSAMEFEFPAGSEEEAEFIGLALSGVPLDRVFQRCLGLSSRPSESELESLMTFDDFRPSLCMAREMGIWFANSDQMDDLKFIEEMPHEIIKAAIDEVIARFDAPTPRILCEVFEGVKPEKEKPYPWATTGLGSNGTGTCVAPKGSYKAKGRSTRKSGFKKKSSWTGYKKKSYSKFKEKY